MKFIILLLLVSMIGFAAAASFEDADIAEYKNDTHRLQEFIDCLLGTQFCCDVDGRMQERLENIITTNCGDCTDKEKSIARDLSWLVINTKTEDVAPILDIYDYTNNVEHYLDSLTNVPSLDQLPSVSGQELRQRLNEFLGHASALQAKDIHGLGF